METMVSLLSCIIKFPLCCSQQLISSKQGKIINSNIGLIQIWGHLYLAALTTEAQLIKKDPGEILYDEMFHKLNHVPGVLWKK